MTHRWMTLAGFALLALAGCGNKDGGALATINSEPITVDDFHRYLEYKPTVNVMGQNGQAVQAQVAEPLAFQGFMDLMRQKLLLQMAKDAGVAATEKDVVAELEFQKKRNPNFVKDLQARGLSLGEIRQSLAVDIARERLITRGITVTKADAEKYYAENPKEFVEPATVDMLWVFVRTPDLQKQVDQELASGQAFASVAQQFSQFPGAKQNPRFPQRVISLMPDPIKAIVNKTGEAQQSTWLKLQDGFAKFYVETKTPEKKIVMDDTKWEFLRRQIAMSKGQAANDIDARLLEKLKTSKIDVKYEELKQPWKDTMERLKQTQMDTKTPTSGGAADAGKAGDTKTPDSLLPAPAAPK